jgi:uncharacterized protein
MGQFLRILIIAIVIWLAIRLVKRFLGHQRARRLDAPPRMLPCANCGVYVPETSAVSGGDQIYCSEEHRQIGPR